MEKVIFLIISVSLTIFLLYLLHLHRNGVFATLLISVLLLFSAFYLFQFGNLSEFKIKGLNAEATFIKEKKQEVLKDVEEINSLKAQMESTKLEVDELARQIEETAEKAAPPTLKLVAKEVKEIDGKVEVIVQFKPNKNVPLGSIVFSVSVEKNSDVNILDIWPDATYGGPFNSGDNSKQIAADGKSASLTYSLLGVNRPTIKITLSGESVIIIAGNYLKEPVQLEMTTKK